MRGARELARRVAFGCYTAAVIALLTLTITAAPETAYSRPTLTHLDRSLDVQVTYPKGWHLQTFSNSVGMAIHSGFILSTESHRFEYPEQEAPEGVIKETNLWDMNELPNNAVVVEVSETPSHGFLCERTWHFPPVIEEARRVQYRPSFGTPAGLLLAVCREGHDWFNVNVWHFPGSSEEDRETAREIVDSISAVS